MEVAEIVGITSIKYYDLKQNRVSPYEFDYEKILDPRGDTGVYLLYMYARIKSIFNKGGYTDDKIQALKGEERIILGTPQERDLAMTVLRFPEFVLKASQDL